MALQVPRVLVGGRRLQASPEPVRGGINSFSAARLMTLCAVVLTFVLAHTPYPTTPLLSAVLYAHSVWPIGLGPPDRLPGTELAYGAVPQVRLGHPY